MLLPLSKQCISRGIISGIACASVYNYFDSKTTIVLIWAGLTLWTDIFKIKDFIYNNNDDNNNINKERRNSWKRDLKINTDNIGTFDNNNINNSLTPIKIKTNNIEEIDECDENKEKRKRKRAGKKVRERLARKKLRLLDEFSNKESEFEENEYITDNATSGAITTESNITFTHNNISDIEYNQSSNNSILDDSNEDEINYNNGSYEDNEDNEGNEDQSYDENNNSFCGNNTEFNNYSSNQNTENESYTNFVKESAKILGYQYDDKENKEDGYITDGDVRFLDEITDEMINHQEIDYDNSRILDPDGYWEDVWTRKLKKHIDKYGKYSDKKIEFEKNLDILIRDLNELKEATSGLRLLGKKYDNHEELLNLNVAWMVIMLSDFAKNTKRLDTKGTIIINKIWLKVSKNISKIWW